MSPRLVIAIAWATIIGAGVITWIIAQPDPTPISEPGAASRPASDTERREYWGKFFGGDPDQNIRGGQEMKPRW
ncbi:entry exclusion protein TrbK [Rhizobium rhizogenes]|uniref:Entry exclusion protein TrbK n=3 Tax=Rhizobium TaxID=379 RepID=A0A2Z2PNW2_RHIRH|nr:entry exclusion protein TrbK [Rhizobium rhizogenes]ASK44363.1 entry exclusion protein TrbK [Rhizobium rhizogenes]